MTDKAITKGSESQKRKRPRPQPINTLTDFFCSSQLPAKTHHKIYKSKMECDLVVVLKSIKTVEKEWESKSSWCCGLFRKPQKAKFVFKTQEEIDQELKRRFEQVEIDVWCKDLKEVGGDGMVAYLLRTRDSRLLAERQCEKIESLGSAFASFVGSEAQNTNEKTKLTVAQRIALTHRIVTRVDERLDKDTEDSKPFAKAKSINFSYKQLVDEAPASNESDDKRNSDDKGRTYVELLSKGLFLRGIDGPLSDSDVDYTGLSMVHAVFPMHDKEWNRQFLAQLTESWHSQWHMSSTDANDRLLNSVRYHFGEEVAMYPAWMFLYIRLLKVLSTLGIAVQIISFFVRGISSVLMPLYALLVVFLSMMFLRAWERRLASYNYMWEIPERDREERPEFKGELRTNKTLMVKEKYYPPHYRIPKLIVTLLVVLAQLVIATVVIGLMFAVYVSAYEPACVAPQNQFIVITLITVVWGVLIELCNYTIFASLAERLTAWENYRLVSEHMHQFTMKIFVFFFIDCYLWYFLLSLVWIPQLTYSRENQQPAVMKYLPWCDQDALSENMESSAPVWTERVSSALLSYLLTTQLIMVFVEDYLPHAINVCTEGLKRRGGPKEAEKASNEIELAEKKSQDSKSKKDSAKPIVEESQRLAVYCDQNIGRTELQDLLQQSNMQPYSPFYDWADMTCQYGYIIFFSILCPLAALMCLLNNWLELNGDMFKVCNTMQRCLPRRSSNVRTWMEIQMQMTFMSALVSSAVLALGTSFADEWFSADGMPIQRSFRVYLMIVIEHVALMFLYMARSMLEVRPQWLEQLELKKQVEAKHKIQAAERDSHNKAKKS